MRVRATTHAELLPVGICRKVDINMMLSTMSGIFRTRAFQYMVWLVNFATVILTGVGLDVDDEGVPPRGCPVSEEAHSPQNFAGGGFSKPQCQHRFVKGVVHSMQNFIPS